jgi:hypothetical protein
MVMLLSVVACCMGRLTFNLFASLADNAERGIMQSHTPK